jgi:hypothetical protein
MYEMYENKDKSILSWFEILSIPRLFSKDVLKGGVGEYFAVSSQPYILHAITITSPNLKVLAALGKLTFLQDVQTQFIVSDLTITAARDSRTSSFYAGIREGQMTQTS